MTVKEKMHNTGLNKRVALLKEMFAEIDEHDREYYFKTGKGQEN